MEPGRVVLRGQVGIEKSRSFFTFLGLTVLVFSLFWLPGNNLILLFLYLPYFLKSQEVEVC